MDVIWDDLHSFLSVSRAGSFLAAARELGVEHTTVARRVARLERNLSTVLLHRGTRGVRLTAAGRALAAALARTEAAVRAATQLASERDERISGTVRIATAEIFATAFLCGRLPELARRYPALEIHVLTGQASVDLSRGEADLAVRLLPPGKAPAEPDVLVRRLGGFAFALFGSRAYLAERPLAANADLGGHDLIGYADVPRAPGAEWLASRSGGARTVMFANAVPVVRAAVAAGSGLAVLPTFYAEQDPSLVRVSGPVAESVLWLLVRPEMKRSRRVAAAHAWLRETISGAFAA